MTKVEEDIELDLSEGAVDGSQHKAPYDVNTISKAASAKGKASADPCCKELFCTRDRAMSSA